MEKESQAKRKSKQPLAASVWFCCMLFLLLLFSLWCCPICWIFISLYILTCTLCYVAPKSHNSKLPYLLKYALKLAPLLPYIILHCNSFKFLYFSFKHININPKLNGGCSSRLMNHLKIFVLIIYLLFTFIIHLHMWFIHIDTTQTFT